MSPSPVFLYNSLTKSVTPLSTINPGQVKVYCCGPTVYHFAHLGNFRTYLYEDILVKMLRESGYHVEHVMNITDVGHLVSDADAGEDKMLVAMRREKKKSEEIAEYYTDCFFKDSQALNITRPNVVCKATEHIVEMIELIKALEQKGFTYFAGGNVYFDIAKCPDYGKLARLKLTELEAGARIEVDSHKKNPHDFVLWFTKSKFENQELQWDSPWGRGYPGWHIECSAMAIKYLGKNFDIHCGGIDHVPVHHTNEIAQSECALGHSWVNIWMHGEFLVNEKNEKIAKSSGGCPVIEDLKKAGIDPLAFRLMCLGTSYRKQLAFSWELLTIANETFKKLKRSVLELKKLAGNISTPPNERFLTEFRKELQNDLGTARGVALLWEVLGSNLPPSEKLSTLYSFGKIFSLGFESWEEETITVPQEVQQLIQDRDTARTDKNWAESDRLRDEIKKHGFVVEDVKGKTTVKRT